MKNTALLLVLTFVLTYGGSFPEAKAGNNHIAFDLLPEFGFYNAQGNNYTLFFEGGYKGIKLFWGLGLADKAFLVRPGFGYQYLYQLNSTYPVTLGMELNLSPLFGVQEGYWLMQICARPAFKLYYRLSQHHWLSWQPLGLSWGIFSYLSREEDNGSSWKQVFRFQTGVGWRYKF